MGRTARAGDWVAIAAEQARTAGLKFGTQPALAGGAASNPFTPGEYAMATFRFWNGNVDNVFAAAEEGGKDVIEVKPAATTGGSGFFKGISDSALSPHLRAAAAYVTERAKDGGSLAVKQAVLRIDLALRTMLEAMARGTEGGGSRNGTGLLCLNPTQSGRFWASVSSLGREYSFLTATSTGIPVDEYWSAFTEGAKDGLRNVGEAAGGILAAAGEAAGAAAGGLLSGLGVVNVAVLVGGGYLVAREVL